MPSTNLRFVHAADLHLDSPLTGFSATAPEHVVTTIREATFEPYDAIIQLCIDEAAEALLVAGDIYDTTDKSLRAQLRFMQGLRRLSQEGIRSFICHGNHDPLDGWEAGFTPPPGCHRFRDSVEAVPLSLDDPQRAVVYGYSYPTQRVSENIARRFTRSDDASFAIGLLHCNAGSNTAHAPYAPCSLDDLAATGIDYWALGHVHTRQTLRNQSPAIVYPGNPQGRHTNETGERGVYLVEVDATGGVSLAFHAVDRVRWVTLPIDISDVDDIEGLNDRVEQLVDEALTAADGRPIIYRLEVGGRGPLHSVLRRTGSAEDLRDDWNMVWGSRRTFAWCDRISIRTGPAFDRAEAREGADFLGQLLAEFDGSKEDASLLGELDELYDNGRVREYLREAKPTAGELPDLLAEAEQLCIDELLEREAQ